MMDYLDTMFQLINDMLGQWIEILTIGDLWLDYN